jgi:hypothetical protein
MVPWRRPPSEREASDTSTVWKHRGSGEDMGAKEQDVNTGNPMRREERSQPEIREEQAGLNRVAESSVVALKRVMIVEKRDLSSKSRIHRCSRCRPERVLRHIPHHELMKSVARRVSDAAMLRLLKTWLEMAVENYPPKFEVIFCVRAVITAPCGVPLPLSLFTVVRRLFPRLSVSFFPAKPLQGVRVQREMA